MTCILNKSAGANRRLALAVPAVAVHVASRRWLSFFRLDRLCASHEYSPILLLVLAGCLGDPSPTTKTGKAKIVAEAQTEAAAGGDFISQLLHEGRLSKASPTK